MKLSNNIKHQASHALLGKRSRAVGIIFITLMVSIFIATLDSIVFHVLGFRFNFEDFTGSVAFSQNFYNNLLALGVNLTINLVAVVLLVPLCCGIINWYYQTTKGKNRSVLAVFYPYENGAASKSIIIYFWMCIATTVMTFFTTFVPGTLIWLGSEDITKYGFRQNIPTEIADVLFFTGLSLTIIMVVILLIWIERYSMSFMLLGEDFKFSVRQAIKKSIHCTKNHKRQLFVFSLSFWPWFVPMFVMLCLTITLAITESPLVTDPQMSKLWQFGFTAVALVTTLVVAPYYQMSRVIYLRYLYEKEIGSYPEKNRGKKSELAENVAIGGVQEPVAPVNGTVPTAKPTGDERC